VVENLHLIQLYFYWKRNESSLRK